MAETFRPPKHVRAAADLAAALSFEQVLSLRDAADPVGTWARSIADGVERRAAQVKEAVVTATHKRAEGADIPIADALVQVLADTFEFYAAAHRAHWNVTGVGADFEAFHSMFGAIYEDAWEAVDVLAERLRQLGCLAPSLAVMPQESTNTEAVALAADLLAETEELAALCGWASSLAAASGQQGIANMLADRQDAHAKWAWQLRSSLGIAEVGVSPASDALMAADMAEDMAEEPAAGAYSADPEVEARRSLIAQAEKRDTITEVRAERAADGAVRIRGYAATWDTEADGLPWREVIKRGAFQRSLDRGDDVFLLVNHDTDQLPLARRSAGTLSLTEDETGLLMEATLDPANPRAAELSSALERGDVDKMSFAFSVAADGSRKREDGVRELRDLNLYEVSVVTWPAYSSTTVGLRNADDDLALRWKRARLAAIQRSI